MREDRADIVYEVRDATDLQPTGTKGWWCELPAGGVRVRGTRLTPEAPGHLPPRVHRHQVPARRRAGAVRLEIDHRTEPWELRDVTTDLIAAGESARGARAAEERETADQAIEALVAEIERRYHAGESALTKDAAAKLLQERGMKQRRAREALVDARACVHGTWPGASSTSTSKSRR